MVKYLYLVAAVLYLAAFSVANAKGPPSPQQQLMVQCNKGWKDYHKANKGVKHKDYMSECMKGTPVTKVRPGR